MNAAASKAALASSKYKQNINNMMDYYKHVYVYDQETLHENLHGLFS